ncbi:branched-chain amino acid ABC transporter permease [Micromonospora sp. U56]|uniref:branched-chain amino acid ABC transporter permease n=1 Tax=Micromonospora sp. U56 TaxID=2824900 RepID=UPI001B398B71|nr:branched-chain amino acid ABC transporter permease [Micromonospora sp. U56]MBQ0894877.1 branched-chain amino acid ABC transporter permease [Micromonospora sp. U56]
MTAALRARLLPATVAVVLVALALLPMIGASVYAVVVLTSVLSYALLAMSISLVAGHAGLLTLAHAAYAGVASYAVALLSRNVTSDALLQLVAAVAAGAGVAALSGWIAVRASKTYFLMLSLAIGELLHVLALQWRGVTHGSDGLSAGQPFTLFGSGPVVLSGYVYWLALAVFLVFGGLVLAVARSPFGAALRGIRDNEPRMRSLGYPTSWYKYGAWVLSGAVAGASGWIAVAQLPRFVAPDALSFHVAGLLLLAVVIGGLQSMWGACLGAAAVALMTNVVSQDLGGHGPLVLGILFLIAVYLLPRGLAGIGKGRRGRPGAIVPDDEDHPAPVDTGADESPRTVNA